LLCPAISEPACVSTYGGSQGRVFECIWHAASARRIQTKGNGKDQGGNHQKYDWGKFGDLLDHENLCSVALALIIGGLGKEATYNLLRAQVEAIDTPDLETQAAATETAARGRCYQQRLGFR
jgi:hypothetical protein